MVRKVTKAKSKKILVAVSRFGNDPLAVEIAEGATVEEVLDKAGIEVESNQQIFNAGEQVDMEDEVESGDVISIVSPKAAGNRY